MIHVRSTVRRLLIPTAAVAYPAYKAKYDPPELVWDLDNTILCSICPHPDKRNDKEENDDNGIIGPFPNDTSRYFDQIDDDFPFEDNVPNTRTYWRPGAKIALQFCSMFSIQHVFTTAQKTYTDNILLELDPKGELFHNIIHRDIRPESVKKGKDLSKITDRLDRTILFDDKLKNFRPQKGKNGVQARLYDETSVRGSDAREMMEMARLVGISVLALLVTDVRDIVPFFNS
mmetsp:Transcript_5913/g.16642  ORF Transcript_5913/g.16642 Transcript_5913/m.16642 type:complete len:231 (-) Transcript_5913:330-1022(-)|eukprot:CAMPEP_0181043116 /NCGR_PEP_ID=MMETSP1070-20121207/12532_1 /TAXON_ID=265543 /ORGANISM="Minutocellus polymorphus, Strain NH13" /LENGTH=230 /DNA_ID=CAMNT_0023121415 /DNA_START=39 /DNA_END=731 /DNA_ORIENTATION=+